MKYRKGFNEYQKSLCKNCLYRTIEDDEKELTCETCRKNNERTWSDAIEFIDNRRCCDCIFYPYVSNFILTDIEIELKLKQCRSCFRNKDLEDNWSTKT